MKPSQGTEVLNKARILKDERGMISLDFVFALCMAIGLSIVFFAISYTLAMVEVSQYLTFAASRAFNGAHETPAAQSDLGLRKFNQLRQNSIFKPLYDMRWIVLGTPTFGDFSQEYNTLSSADRERNSIFVGTRVRFEAKVLNIQVPMLGRTATKPTTGVAELNSYLMREVTTQECREEFTVKRYEMLRELNAAYKNTPSAREALITDNGC